MAELQVQSPCAGLLPVACGAVQLEEIDMGRLTTLAPFAGQQSALSDALQAAYGLRYPAPNEAVQNSDMWAIWFGRDMALLVGPDVGSDLGALAALTDQTDGWACVTLSGEGGSDVLARLVPVDVRPAHFAPGRTMRTLLGHMNVSITCLSENQILVLAFRSMAQTLVDEVQEAMEAVAARR